jgi:hypothetical protein
VQVQGEVVFVGYGINAPELKWNDYAGVDVHGKWVMIMVNDPPAPADEPTLFGGTALTYYGRWTYKFEEAARQGAAGALLIHTDESATYPWQVVQTSWSGTQYSLPPQAGAPALGIKAWITNAAAKDLAKRGGRDLDTMRAAASKRGFKPVTLNIRAAATLMQRSSRKTAANVIGVLKGTNPSEGVIYSAHWDHFGIRDPQPATRRTPIASSTALTTTRRAAPACSKSRRRSRRRRKKPARSIYFRVRDGGGVGTARLGVPRRESAAADRQDRRQHQHRRRQLPRRHEGHGPTGIGAFVDRADDRDDSQGARPHADRRHPPGARLLLPLGSLLVREAGRAGDLAERAETVHRLRTPPICSRSRRLTTTRIITSRAISTIRRGILPAAPTT